MSINKMHFKKYINISIVFLMVYFSSSKFALHLEGRSTLSILLFISILALFNNFNAIKKRINIGSLLVFLCLFFLSMLILLINQDSIYWYLITWSYLIASYSIYVSINYENYIEIFNNVIFYTALFSLLIYFVYILNIWNFSIFPEFLGFRNLFFIILKINKASMDAYRNYAFFWEPGAYQTFLNIALIFELFSKEKASFKRIVILFVSVLTTLSVAGYIAMFVTLVAYITERRNHNNLLKSGKMLTTLFFIIIISWSILPQEYKLQVLGKASIFSNTSDKSNISGFARINALIIPLSYYIKKPIFGLGMDKFTEMSLNEAMALTTFTPINWFAKFGIIWGALCNCLFLNNIRRFKVNRITKLILMLSLILTISAQDYSINPSILVLVFYGLDVKKAIKTKKA